MVFSREFLNDEVREGFYIPAMVKAAWAAQLEVLEDIKRVCNNHGISYCADWGTLLGAVRHGGFIPWDDDLDISMKREDLNKFIKVAKTELGGEYDLINYRKHGRLDDFIIRVINSKVVHFDKKFLDKFHGFPYVAGVDIFPMDFLSDDEKFVEEQITVAEKLVSYIKLFQKETVLPKTLKEIKEYIDIVEKHFGVKVSHDESIPEQLAKLVEAIFAITKEEDAKYITLFPNLLNFGAKAPKELYQEFIELPFENTTITVPKNLHEVMVYKYGANYKVPYRGGGLHEYPCYTDQEISVNERVKFPECRYEYSEDDLIKGAGRNYGILKETGILWEAHFEIANNISDINVALDLLASCQELAIKIGEMFDDGNDSENVEDKNPVIAALENYCEMVFYLYQALNNCEGNLNMAVLDIVAGGVSKPGRASENDKRMGPVATLMSVIDDALENVEVAITSDENYRKTIVFICDKAEHFSAFESTWREYKEKGDADVYVVAIPTFEKEPDGSKGKMYYDGANYPSYVELTPMDKLNLEVVHPDEIYICNPFDNGNYTEEVPGFFYASVLREYTNRLIYIPYFLSYNIDSTDFKAIRNIEYCACQRGVMLADEVWVQSENIKKLYVKALSKFAGVDVDKDIVEDKDKALVEIFNEKIVEKSGLLTEHPILLEEWKNKIYKTDGTKKKVILFAISYSSALAEPEKTIEKLKKCYDIFKSNKEEIVVIFNDFKHFDETLKSVAPDYYNGYKNVVDAYKKETWCIYDEKPDLGRNFGISNAFYGDHCEISDLYRMTNKPIMIIDINI